MSAIRGKYVDGTVVLDAPADWPNGTEVVVEPASNGESIGTSEEEWDNSPEGIADWLRWYDALEPLEFTPEEEAAIAAWRKTVKEYTIANADKGIKGLFP